MTVKEAVAAYVALRDKRDAVKKRHSDELAPYTEAMLRLEGWLLDQLNASGADSMASGAGTVYKREETSVTVADWQVLLPWIIAHEKWELLKRAVNPTYVDYILEETQALPPGVNYRKEIKIGVRRGKDAATAVAN